MILALALVLQVQTKDLPNSAHVAALHDGIIYVTAGLTDVDHTPRRTLYASKTGSGTWQALSKMKLGRHFPAAAIVNDRLYVASGLLEDGNVTPSVEYYSFPDKSWHDAPPLNLGRSRFSMFAYKDSLYAVGGIAARGKDLNSGSIERLDPKAKKWVTLPHPMAPRHGFAGVILKDRLYVFGGYGGDQVSTAEAFDFHTGKWSRLAGMPSPRGFFGVAAVGSRIYAFGGRQSTRTVDVYDSATNRWMRSNTPDLKLNRFAYVLEGKKLWVIGGEENSGPYVAPFPYALGRKQGD